jgi:O-antigen/teichoic acid export membrane protein
MSAGAFAGPPDDRRPRKKKEKKKSYGKAAKVGVLWTVAQQLMRHGVAIPASMVMARLLSPGEFGIAAAAAFFVTFTHRMTELGLNAALVRLKKLRPDHESSVFAVSLALGVLSWGALVAAAPLVGDFFRSAEVGRVVSISAWAFLITPWSTVPSALLHRRLRFKAMAVVDWAGTIVGAVLAIVLAWRGYSYWSLVYGQLASTGVTVVAKMAVAWWTPSLRVSREALSELWSFGIGVQTKRILEFATQNLDNLLVGRTIGIVALGLYDKAFMTVQRVHQTLNLGPAVSFRIFAILQDDTSRFRRAYQKVLLTVAVLSIPPLAVCVIVAPHLFEVMYGATWLPAVPAFQVLCLASMIKLTSTHAARANEAKGLIWRQVMQHVAYVILIVLGVWVGSRWGITGVAVGVLSARLTLAVLIHNLLRQAIDASWSDMLRPLVPGAAVGAVTVAVVAGAGALVRQFDPQPQVLLLLAVQALAAVLVYVPLVAYSPFQDLRAVVRETIEDFAPRLLRWAPTVPPPAPAPDVTLTKVG